MSKDKELKVGYIEPKEPGVFATLILPEVREAMKAGATITALGVSCGSTAIGAVCAVVSHTDTLEILSLYVAPKYRRMGAATLMMDTFHSFLPEAINRISIDYVAADKETEALDHFLESYGAALSESPIGIYRTGISEIKNAYLVKHGRAGSGVKYFSELSPEDIRGLNAFSNVNMLPRPEEGFDSSDIEKSYSLVLKEWDKIIGYLVADYSFGGFFTISAIYFDNDTDILSELLSGFVAAAEKKNMQDSLRIYIPAVDYELAELLKELLPQAKNIDHNYEIMFV